MGPRFQEHEELDSGRHSAGVRERLDDPSERDVRAEAAQVHHQPEGAALHRLPRDQAQSPHSRFQVRRPEALFAESQAHRQPRKGQGRALHRIQNILQDSRARGGTVYEFGIGFFIVCVCMCV